MWAQGPYYRPRPIPRGSHRLSKAQNIHPWEVTAKGFLRAFFGKMYVCLCTPSTTYTCVYKGVPEQLWSSNLAQTWPILRSTYAQSLADGSLMEVELEGVQYLCSRTAAGAPKSDTGTQIRHMILISVSKC